MTIDDRLRQATQDLHQAVTRLGEAPPPTRSPRPGWLIAAATAAVVIVAVGGPMLALSGTAPTGTDVGAVSTGTVSATTSTAAVTATTAVARSGEPGVFDPDPADVAAIERDGALVADSHSEGWRPELRTEAVWCMVDSSVGADTTASGFPLGEPLTFEALYAECGTGNDVARNLDTPPTEFTVCEATFTDETYRERIGVDERFIVVGGDLKDDRPGFPVVLTWEAECTTTHLDTSWDVALGPLDSLADINLAREIEISLRASALTSCLSMTEARVMAADARAELGEQWLLLEWDPDVPGGCYMVDIDPQWGTILAQPRV